MNGEKSHHLFMTVVSTELPINKCLVLEQDRDLVRYNTLSRCLVEGYLG